MAPRRLLSVTVVSLLLAACSAAPADPPASVPTVPVDSGPAVVLDRARTVANDLEQRDIQIDAQMRDPFSPP